MADSTDEESVFEVQYGDALPDGMLPTLTPEDYILLDAVPFFHTVDRFLAECLLMQGGQKGSFLLRPAKQAEKGAALSVSLRAANSVLHFLYRKLPDGTYRFETQQDSEDELAHFLDLENLLGFLKSAPVFGVPTAVEAEPERSIQLLYPYPRNSETLGLYEKVVMRGRVAGAAEANPRAVNAVSVLPMTTREGYMTKLGAIKKNWKLRYFVLSKQTLYYYKENPADNKALRPLRAIDLTKCTDVLPDKLSFPSYTFCFRLESPGRTFYFVAGQQEDMDMWIEALKYNMHLVPPPTAVRGESIASSKLKA